MSLQRSSASFDQSTHQPAIEAVEACIGSDMTTRLSFLRWVSAALVAASPAVAGVSAQAATAGMSVGSSATSTTGTGKCILKSTTTTNQKNQCGAAVYERSIPTVATVAANSTATARAAQRECIRVA